MRRKGKFFTQNIKINNCLVHILIIQHRLKDWVAKQAEREQEKEERKKKKLEKLKQEFRHEFHDPEYNKERAEVTDKVHEAIEQGMKAACSSEPAPKKRKSEGPALKKTALWY